MDEKGAAQLRAELEHAAGIALLSVGQPDRAGNMEWRDALSKRLQEAESEGEKERDATCGLCDADADRVAFTHDRHTGACWQHVAWACNVLSIRDTYSMEVTVRPRMERNP